MSGNPWLHKIVDLYDDYSNDHLETYRWLVKFARENNNLFFAFMADARFPLHPEVKKILDNSNVRIVGEGDSYKEAFYAGVVTTYHSTIGYELLSKGRPLFFCNPRGISYYLSNTSRFRRYTAQNYNEFSEKVKFLISDDALAVNKYIQDFEYFCKPAGKASEIILNALK